MDKRWTVVHGDARGLCGDDVLVCARGIDAWVAGGELPYYLHQTLHRTRRLPWWRDPPGAGAAADAAQHVVLCLAWLATNRDRRHTWVEPSARAWIARCRACLTENT